MSFLWIFFFLLFEFIRNSAQSGTNKLCIFHFTEHEKQQLIDKGLIFNTKVHNFNNSDDCLGDAFCATEFPEVYLGACPNTVEGLNIVRNELINKICTTNNGTSKMVSVDEVSETLELFENKILKAQTEKTESNIRLSRLITEKDHLMNDTEALKGDTTTTTKSSQWNFDSVGGSTALMSIYGNTWKKHVVEDYNDKTSTVIVIIDDGLDINHPEFENRVVNKYNKNYLTDPVSSDPTPSSLTDNHGTMCGSVASGDYGNNICGFGISPFTYISGRRLIDGYVVYKTIIDAFSDLDPGLILSNSWGFSVCTKTNSLSSNKEENSETTQTKTKSCSYLADNEALYSAINSVGEKNFITFASGNTGYYTDGDSNLELLGRLTNAYTVGATEQNYKKTTYSSPSASLFISAPVGGDYTDGVPAALNSATSSSPRCTSSFAGTSAAAPQIAGAAALVLESLKKSEYIKTSNEFTPRDIANVISATSYWPETSVLNKTNIVLNSAGVKHSRDIGFGVLKLDDAVTFVKSGKYIEFPSSAEVYTTEISPNKKIVDNAKFNLDFSGLVSDDFIVESVIVEISGTNVNSGNGITSTVSDCEITITSPVGTESILLYPTKSSFNTDYLPGRLHSRQFLGEHGRGVWSVMITDSVSNGRTSVLVEQVKVKLYGHTSLVSFSNIPSTKDGILQVSKIELKITPDGQKAITNYESKKRSNGETYTIDSFDLFLQSVATTEAILVQRLEIDNNGSMYLNTTRLDAASKKVSYGRLITVPVVTKSSGDEVYDTKKAFLPNTYTYAQSRSNVLFSNPNNDESLAVTASRPFIFMGTLIIVFVSLILFI